MVFLQAEWLLGMLFGYGACCLSVMGLNPALLSYWKIITLYPYWRGCAPNGMSIVCLKVIFCAQNMGRSHSEARMNKNVPQASPRRGRPWSKDRVKLPSLWYNYWEKWAACNYDDIKPDKIFGPDFFLIYTGMNQETERRPWPNGVLQINLRLNEIEIFHSHDTRSKSLFALLLEARYIYGANYTKITAVN